MDTIKDYINRIEELDTELYDVILLRSRESVTALVKNAKGIPTVEINGTNWGVVEGKDDKEIYKMLVQIGATLQHRKGKFLYGINSTMVGIVGAIIGILTGNPLLLAFSVGVGATGFFGLMDRYAETINRRNLYERIYVVDLNSEKGQEG